jgi:hypothetical protein
MREPDRLGTVDGATDDLDPLVCGEDRGKRLGEETMVVCDQDGEPRQFVSKLCTWKRPRLEPGSSGCS